MIRVEKIMDRGQEKYFLTLNFGVDGLSRHIRKYIGSTPPTQNQIRVHMAQHWGWFEYELIDRKAALSSQKFSTELLGEEEIINLERIRFSFQSVLNHLNPNELEKYNEDFELNYIHGTTAIEGNTMTLPQVHRLLTDGSVPKERSKREIYEVENFMKVQRFRESYSGDVDIPFIKKLNSLILDNIDYENAGLFRRIDVSVGGEFRGSPPLLIGDELEELMAWYEGNRFVLRNWQEDDKPPVEHPFTVATLFHERFERIHPFIDGNGRVGREIFNFMLRKNDYPRFLFRFQDRDAYLEALTRGREGDQRGMVKEFYKLYVNTIAGMITDHEERAAIIEDKLRIQRRLEDFFEKSD